MEAGEGENVMVFLHGFLGRPELMQETAQALKGKNYRVLAPYLPGHGESFVLPDGFNFDDLVVTMGEWLNEVFGKEPAKTVALVGHSLGGALAWELAATGLGNVRKVLLIDPGLGLINKSVFKKVFSYFQNITLDFPGNTLVSFIRMARFGWRQVWYAPRLSSMLLGVRICVTGLPKNIEALALWGESDGLTPYTQSRELLERSRVPVKFFPGSHHWFIAHPELYLLELETFL